LGGGIQVEAVLLLRKCEMYFGVFNYDIYIPVSSKGWSKRAPYKKHPESTPYFLRVILMGTARTNPWMILDLRYFYN